MDGLLAQRNRTPVYRAEREKEMTVNTVTHAHRHIFYTYTQVLLVRRFSLFIKRHFIPSSCAEFVVEMKDGRYVEERAGEIRGEKWRTKARECILSYNVIFFYLIDGLYVHTIIKMIEDSIFRFNACHYFHGSCYLFFFLFSPQTSPQTLRWQKRRASVFGGYILLFAAIRRANVVENCRDTAEPLFLVG